MTSNITRAALRRCSDWARTRVPFVLLSILVASAAWARDGENDPTFNPFDDGTSGSGTSGLVYAVAVRPDGSVAIGGAFSWLNGQPRSHVALVHPDGSTGASLGSGASDDVRAIVAQPDGGLILGGSFLTVGGVQRTRIARLSASGALDLSYFGTGAGVNSTVYALALQADGRVVLGGSFGQVHGVTCARVARLTTSGALDSSFASTPGAQGGDVYALAMQPDGKILVGGTFTAYAGAPRMGCARLNTDGTLDTSFQPGAGIGGSGTLQVRALAVAPDGKIWIGGQFTTFDGAPRVRLARLDTDGSLDLSCDPGTSANALVHALSVQPDGRCLVAGEFTQFAGAALSRVARLNLDGSVDASFDPGAGCVGGSAYALARQSDGRVVIVGGFSAFDSQGRKRVARMEADGALDATFNANRGADGTVWCATAVAGGGYVLGGDFRTFNGSTSRSLARLLADGSPDPSFAQGAGLAHSSTTAPAVYTLAEQPDGRLVIGGLFHTYDGVPRDSLARVHPDGSLDTSFDTGVDIFGFMYALALQSDGKVIVGGTFDEVAGVPRGKLARFHPDGSLDLGFATGAGVIGAGFAVRALALQPDGKVLVGGDFNNFDGVLRRGIVRVDAQGHLDPSFNSGDGVGGTVSAILHEPDGRVTVAGNFSSSVGGPFVRIARLLSDGALDPSFQPGVGANGAILTLARQPDSKYVIGGVFTAVGGLPRSRLARLQANGAVDSSFVVGSGAEDSVQQIELLDDGRALMVGAFTNYSGVVRHGAARVVAYTPQPTSYCTAGASAQGCTPAITSSGLPRVSLTSGFTLTVQGLPGQRQGLFFYGVDGRLAAPWAAGSSSFRCVEAPTQRLSVQSSGGTVGACDGLFAQDWRAWIAARPGALGQPLFAGERFDAQSWYRDPLAPKGTNLSDALEFFVAP